MATKSCDDPMDLGPFLENYVLKNPFGQPFFSASSTSSSSTAANADIPTSACSEKTPAGRTSSGLLSRHSYKARQRRLSPSPTRPTSNGHRTRPTHRLELEVSSGSKTSLTADLKENVENSATSELMENAVVRLRKVVAERNGWCDDEADSEILDVEHLAMLAWCVNHMCVYTIELVYFSFGLYYMPADFWNSSRFSDM